MMVTTSGEVLTLRAVSECPLSINFLDHPRSVVCNILDTNDRKIVWVSNHLHRLEYCVVFGLPFLMCSHSAEIFCTAVCCGMNDYPISKLKAPIPAVLG